MNTQLNTWAAKTAEAYDKIAHTYNNAPAFIPSPISQK